MKYNEFCCSHLSVSHDRPLKDTVHAQDCRLGRVDDGSSEERAKDSSVADGEGTSVHVLHSQLVILGFLSQRCDTFLNIGVAHGLNVSQHWHHKTLTKSF